MLQTLIISVTSPAQHTSWLLNISTCDNTQGARQSAGVKGVCHILCGKKPRNSKIVVFHRGNKAANLRENSMGILPGSSTCRADHASDRSEVGDGGNNIVFGKDTRRV